MNFCPNCGKSLNHDQKFCANCGSSLASATAAPFIGLQKHAIKSTNGFDNRIIVLFNNFQGMLSNRAKPLIDIYAVLLFPFVFYIITAIKAWDNHLSRGHIVIRILEGGHIFLLVYIIHLLRKGVSCHRRIIIAYVLWLWYCMLLSDITMMNWRSIRFESQSNAIAATLLIYFPLAICLSVFIAIRWSKLSIIFVYLMRVVSVVTIVAALYGSIFDVARSFELSKITHDLEPESELYFLYSWYCWGCILTSSLLAYAVGIKNILFSDKSAAAY
jgi:hypothetical protein